MVEEERRQLFCALIRYILLASMVRTVHHAPSDMCVAVRRSVRVM